MSDQTEVKKVLEAALLTAPEPLQLADLKKLFDGELGNDVLRNLLDELKADWQDRNVELTQVAGGWRFRAKPEVHGFLQKLNPQRAPRYARAVMETLAIVAYKQPCTRGDIEDIRGVIVSSQVIKALEVRGWIEVVGHREVPGRPELFATTKQFLDDLNLRSLDELPPLEELGTLVEATQPPVEAGGAATSFGEGLVSEPDEDAAAGSGAADGGADDPARQALAAMPADQPLH
ncbi:MAG: SMC-Scp complex subunit ScpB [Burkholderiales bacterium]